MTSVVISYMDLVHKKYKYSQDLFKPKFILTRTMKNINKTKNNKRNSKKIRDN